MGGEKCATWRVDLCLSYGLLCQVLAFYTINAHSAAWFHSSVSLLGCLWVSCCGRTRWESCSFSSSTELPISQSCASSSRRERCSTMPAPRESPRTLVVVLRRSLKNRREKMKYSFLVTTKSIKKHLQWNFFYFSSHSNNWHFNIDRKMTSREPSLIHSPEHRLHIHSALLHSQFLA